MCVLQDIRIEDVILELKDGKDFNAVFMLGEKSFQIHLGMSKQFRKICSPIKKLCDKYCSFITGQFLKSFKTL